MLVLGRVVRSSQTETKMTKTFDLTANELKASMIIVKDCLAGMGGKRPIDLDYDPYTWTDAKVLMANGFNRHEAAGTFGALIEKGMVIQCDKNEWALTEAGYRWLDTVWEEV